MNNKANYSLEDIKNDKGNTDWDSSIISWKPIINLSQGKLWTIYWNKFKLNKEVDNGLVIFAVIYYWYTHILWKMTKKY